MNSEDYASWVRGSWPTKADSISIPATHPLAGRGGETFTIQIDTTPPTAFEESVHIVMSEAAELLLRKHNDYGPGNISGAPGGALNGIRVRLYDKIARINHLLDTGAEPQNESLEDSFRDALNYCAIALLVMGGKWPE